MGGVTKLISYRNAQNLLRWQNVSNSVCYNIFKKIESCYHSILFPLSWGCHQLPWAFMSAVTIVIVKAIYIRLGDWSFLNGDKTNFVEVFKHWLSLKSFTNHEIGSPTSIFMSIFRGVTIASLPVDQLGVSSNLRGSSFFSHFYRGLLQIMLHEVK